MREVTLAYFGLHALMFGGAIYFRSYALVKTALSVVVIGFGLVAGAAGVGADLLLELLPDASAGRSGYSGAFFRSCRRR